MNVISYSEVDLSGSCPGDHLDQAKRFMHAHASIPEYDFESIVVLRMSSCLEELVEFSRELMGRRRKLDLLALPHQVGVDGEPGEVFDALYEILSCHDEALAIIDGLSVIGERENVWAQRLMEGSKPNRPFFDIVRRTYFCDPRNPESPVFTRLQGHLPNTLVGSEVPNHMLRTLASETPDPSPKVMQERVFGTKEWHRWHT